MKIKNAILEVNPGNMKREVTVIFSDNSEKKFKLYNTKKKDFPFIHSLLNYYKGNLGFLQEPQVKRIQEEVVKDEYYF